MHGRLATVVALADTDGTATGILEGRLNGPEVQALMMMEPVKVWEPVGRLRPETRFGAIDCRDGSASAGVLDQGRLYELACAI